MSETGELILIGIAVCGAFAAVGVLTILIGLNLAEELLEKKRRISVTSVFSADDTENQRLP